MLPLKLNTLLLALLLFPPAAFSQDQKQVLNDKLWEAARSGDAAVVTALLDQGAEVNAKFRYGATALFKAAERGNLEVVKVLLARGADVTAKDTFYGATAMTWALDNNHDEVVRALLEKSTDGVDDVLLTGARGKKVSLVRIALDRGGATAAALRSALVAATMGDNQDQEIADLIRKAGAVPPPQVDAATLQTYVGKYKGESGRVTEIALKDGTLSATFGGQPAMMLVPIDKTSFAPASFGGLNITFKLENNQITGLEVKQGPNVTLLKRIEDTKQP